MRYEISHVIYCLPWNIIITFQWFTFITKQFPHILTNYLKSHYTGIKCHNPIRWYHKVGRICCKATPFIN